MGVLGHRIEGLTETSWLIDAVEPAFAESCEHSPDRLTCTFRLRRDVTWQDDAPFAAHDVAFTFNDIIYNPNVEANPGRRSSGSRTRIPAPGLASP